MLSAALGRVVVWGYIPINPAMAVRRPRVTAADRSIVTPEEVETMRATLLAQDRVQDAVLITTLAYAGLRPEEALALRWSDIGEQTINVQSAIVDGVVSPTKTRQIRHVTLLAPLAEDLRILRASGSDARPGELLWPRQQDDLPWREYDYRNWRRRLYQPLAAQCRRVSVALPQGADQAPQRRRTSGRGADAGAGRRTRQALSVRMTAG